MVIPEMGDFPSSLFSNILFFFSCIQSSITFLNDLYGGLHTTPTVKPDFFHSTSGASFWRYMFTQALTSPFHSFVQKRRCFMLSGG